MSTAFSDIPNLLESKLVALALGLPVVWENLPLVPPATPFLQATTLPAAAQAAGLGVNAQNRVDGVFQVSVWTPAETGRGAGLTYADQIATGFKRGTNLSTGNTRIVTTAVSRAPSFVDDSGWFHTPVSVSFFAYTDN
jgi:hypothetical protein